MKNETEKQISEFLQTKLELYLEKKYHACIERKVLEIFGDGVEYFDNLVKTKQGIDPEKINALRDYIQELTKIFREGIGKKSWSIF